MRFHTRLLKILLSDFVCERKAAGFSKGAYPMPGDGDRSLAYIAVRRFDGDCIAYRDWLVDYHSKDNYFGSTQPIDALHTDRENYITRQALMNEWHARYNMLVPRPRSIPLYKRVYVDGWHKLVPIPQRPASAA